MERIETTEAIIKDGNFTLEKDVGIFENFLSADECDKLIVQFENDISNGFGISRIDQGEHPTIKEDMQVYYSTSHFFPDQFGNFQVKFWNDAWAQYTKYLKKYTTLRRRQIR